MSTPAAVGHTPTPDKSTSDFLVKDYELKIRYLSDHFTRMWNRFNYFVAIESALVSGKFFFGNGKLSQGLAVIGAVLAFVWYVMGAEDRYLVEVYRKHVEDAGALVAQALWQEKGALYRHVGEIEETSRTVPQNISGWRLKAVSTTKLAALIPLLLTLTWIGLLFSKQ
jgi:hypothetical protein